MDLVSGAHLRLRQDGVLREQVDVLPVDVGGHAVHGVPQIGKPPAGSLRHPGVVVAVAVEDDALVGGKRLLQQLLQGGLEVLRLLQPVGELAQLLSHDGVEHHVGAGDGLRGAQHTELELVAGEGQRGGAVAVGGVLRDLRHGVHAHLQLLLGDVHILCALHDGVQNGGQLVAEEDGDDGGRGLVAAQTVIVARVGHAAAQHLLILVHALDERRQKQQELGILAGSAAGLQQVLTGVGLQRPVVVLAGAVDTGEGLLVEQTHQPVAGGHLLQQLHGQLVLVAGGVGIGEDGRDLVLGGRDLVVLRLGQHPKLPQLLVQLPHERGHPGLDGAVVVVVQLLPLGGLCTEQRPAAELQILPQVVYLPVDEEILLLRTHLRGDVLCLRVAEQPEDADALPVKLPYGAQQRCFLVQRLPTVGAEDGGDIQGAVLDEGVGRGIPRCVAPGLERGPQAAGGKAGCVGLALVQLLGAQLHADGVRAVPGDEAVVLFGGEAGHGLEPVGKVRRALLQRPCLHAVGNVVGNGKRQRFAFLQTRAPGVHGSGLDVLLHRLLVKYTAAEQGRNPIGGLIHVCILLFCA